MLLERKRQIIENKRFILAAPQAAIYAEFKDAYEQ
jgi:hypothetical protein